MRIVGPSGVPCRFIFIFLLFLLGFRFPIAKSDEPVERFLARLKEEQMFELALVYLEEMNRGELLSAEAQANLPLDRLGLLKDSVSTIRSLSERQKRQNELESGYRAFLEKSGEHPRRSEASLGLADLLLSRGQSALDKAKSRDGTEADREAARKDFTSSRELFQQTTDRLRPILQEMQGARIALDDAKGIELREKYQFEYRQAELLRGIAAKYVAESFDPANPEFKRWLETSESELTEVVKKTTGGTEAGRHALALLYRGQVQALLGKVDEANDSFVRVADIVEGGPFREWKAQATAALIRLLANPEQNKFEAVIGRADALLKTMQNHERSQPQWVDLQMATAEGKASWSKLLEGQPSSQVRSRALRNEARTSLQSLARRPGPHLAKAKELLSELGVEASTQSEDQLPELKSLKQAVSLAVEKLDHLKDDELAMTILKGQLETAPEERKSEIASQIEVLNDGMKKKLELAQQILHVAVTMNGKDDSKEDLHRARYFLSIALLRLDRTWEGLAIAEFLTRHCSSDEIASDAGRLALFAYRKILSKDSERQSTTMKLALESLANWMIEKWPTAESTQEAIGVLIEESWNRKQWDDALRYVAMLPDGEKSGAVRRDLGVVFWALYRETSRDRRKQGLDESDEDRGLQQKAESLLRAGFDSLSGSELDQRAVECGSSLASNYLKTNRLAEARAVLDHPEKGPLAAARNSDLKLEPRVRLEALRLNLQCLVMQWIGEEKGTADNAALEAALNEIQSVSRGSPDGDKLLAASLVTLAQDLTGQIDQSKSMAESQKLAKGIETLTGQLVRVSKDINVLAWAGAMLRELAEKLEAKSAPVEQVRGLAKTSAIAYENILEIEKQSPGSIASTNRKPEDFLLFSAASKSIAGDYQEAMRLFSQLLTNNNNHLTGQLKAAETLERWAKNNRSTETWKQAYLGFGELKKGEPIVWGWGRLSKRLSNQPNLTETFFECRLKLAEARFQLALLETDSTKRGKLLEQALGDIKTTILNFPNAKSSSWSKPLDELARKIQRELKQEAVGTAPYFSSPQ